jgi:hypothetical protein
VEAAGTFAVLVFFVMISVLSRLPARDGSGDTHKAHRKRAGVAPFSATS